MVDVAPLDDAPPAKVERPTASATPGPMQAEASPETPVRAGDGRQAAMPKAIASEPETPKPLPAAADPLMGATTLLVRVAPGVEAVDDLNGRKVAVGYADAARQAAVAATFRSLSLTPDLVTLQSDEAERQFQAGKVTAIATLADNAAAAQAPDKVLKLRLEPYVVRQLHQPPS